MPRPPRRLTLLLMLTLGACARWTTARPPYPADFPRRQQVQVWTQTQAYRLHAVAIRNDTLSGVPFTLPPECDSCRVALPLTQIDSLKKGGSDTGPILLIMIPATLLVIFLLSFRNHLSE